VPATPPPAGRGAQPTFPPGQYPVLLPAVSHLGARNDLPNPFQAGVRFRPASGQRKWGSTASVTTAPDGTLWVVDRCGRVGRRRHDLRRSERRRRADFPVRHGRAGAQEFGAGLFVSPHKLTVDPDGNLWVADNGSHQVFKLNPADGSVLMTLGKKGVAGPGMDEFDAPTEVAVAVNGDIYVGRRPHRRRHALGNARIMKFDRNGKFLKTWGKKGMGPGEFDVPHTVALDSKGRVFVGDRQNNRIQIFDADGNFIAQWFQFGRPSGIYIDKKTDTLYVADSGIARRAHQHRRLALAQTATATTPGSAAGSGSAAPATAR
jgi:DNA-binding beta-propeller fold protein YncE